MACRSYCPYAQCNQDLLTITDPGEIHHIKNVLRLKTGAELAVFDGRGTEYLGVISVMSSESVNMQVREIKRGQSSRPSVILACAIPKKGKFEMIIEKAAELGADEIIPLLTRRTEVILKGESIEKKRQRFESVAVSAAKQCGRLTVPLIHPPMKFADALVYLKSKTTRVMPSLSGDRKPFIRTLESLDHQKGVSFLIGPEGDFTPEEYRAAWEDGCIPVSLGETVLRVETAAISVVAAAQLYFDAASAGGGA